MTGMPNSFGLAWSMRKSWSRRHLDLSEWFALAEAFYLENVLGFKKVLPEVMGSIEDMFGGQRLVGKQFRV